MKPLTIKAWAARDRTESEQTLLYSDDPRQCEQQGGTIMTWIGNTLTINSMGDFELQPGEKKPVTITIVEGHV